MNCKNCEYPLWNLRTRVCPECGEPFRPSEFRFALSSVRFCCPHCAQPYYGTTRDGHLEPRSFTCVSCATPIDIDEMVLLPAHGVDERLTRPDTNPWLDKERRWFNRWYSTIARGVVSPAWLLRCTPAEGGAARAWLFALLTHGVFALLSALPLLLLSAAVAPSRGGVGGAMGFAAVALLGFVGIATAGLGLWVAVAHGLLRLTGGTAAGIGRTAQALCYTCGPQALYLVPCLNIYFGWIGTLWWAVAAGFALAAAQRVGGWRAAVAVGLLPAACAAAAVGLIAWGIVSEINGTTVQVRTSPPEAVSRFQRPIDRAVMAGSPPQHAIELITDWGVPAGQFVAPWSGRLASDTSIGAATLEQIDAADAARLAPVIKLAASAGAGPHRLGDFVFCFDALPHGPDEPSLWLVVEAWDPRPGSMQQFEFPLLTAGGEVLTVPLDEFAGELAEQNALRGLLGLPPMPDPRLLSAPGPGG